MWWPNTGTRINKIVACLWLHIHQNYSSCTCWSHFTINFSFFLPSPLSKSGIFPVAASTVTSTSVKLHRYLGSQHHQSYPLTTSQHCHKQFSAFTSCQSNMLFSYVPPYPFLVCHSNSWLFGPFPHGLWASLDTPPRLLTHNQPQLSSTRLCTTCILCPDMQYHNSQPYTSLSSSADLVRQLGILKEGK